MTIPLEIAESAAQGPVGAIYDDIKACLASPMVNQIYRRMAALPGCLEWGWGTVRPFVLSGALEAQGRALMDGLRDGQAAIITTDDLRSAGVDEEAATAIGSVCEAYNRSNPMNLIAAKLLKRALDAGAPAGGFTPARARSDANPPPALPPLVDIDDADAELQDLFSRLARQASGGSEAIAPTPTPTLFRHLGHWPGFLALAAESVSPLAESGALRFAAKGMEDGADRIAARLLASGTVPHPVTPAPSGDPGESLRELLILFPPTICGMIVIGCRLRRSLPS